MLDTFLATLEPMLMLFLCIAVGFVAKKAKLLPDNAGTVMAKLETWIFCPALSFITMANNCTIDTLSTHGVNILLSSFCVALALIMAISLARLFVRTKCPERGIYMYALAFANGGYVGDPIVLSIFGEVALSYYKLFYLPFSILIYTWGISVLVPDAEGTGKKNIFKKILNAPTVAMFIGIAVGLSGLGAKLPSFIGGTMSSLSACMGPVAMLLAGFTVAKYDFRKMLTNKKVYVASLLRLFVLPTVIIGALFGLIKLFEAATALSIGNSPLFLVFFATAAPLGLNTVVFPEAYGGDPETGASMALISHTLCVISIPIMFSLMVSIFGTMAL
jgi:predicted permease